jgi:hypothetical protein
MVAQACNPVLWRLRQEDCEFEASLGYIVRSSLKERKEKCLYILRIRCLKQV